MRISMCCISLVLYVGLSINATAANRFWVAAAASNCDEIYHAAEIQAPAHGYTITKVTEMLQSERIRTLPAEVKKNSVLLALDAAGVKIEEVIEDAVKRDRALDGFERVQQK